jgi:hypothetical protein
MGASRFHTAAAAEAEADQWATALAGGIELNGRGVRSHFSTSEVRAAVAEAVAEAEARARVQQRRAVERAVDAAAEQLKQELEAQAEELEMEHERRLLEAMSESGMLSGLLQEEEEGEEEGEQAAQHATAAPEAEDDALAALLTGSFETSLELLRGAPARWATERVALMRALAEVQDKYEASEARAAEAGRLASQVESQVEMRAMSIYERMQRAAAAPALAPPAPTPLTTPPLADVEQEI